MMKSGAISQTASVALLAEGVDRNLMPSMPKIRAEVALLAEGVDRNLLNIGQPGLVRASPSSRRAWIEIIGYPADLRRQKVALLAEGVDRNPPNKYGNYGDGCRPPRGGRG